MADDKRDSVHLGCGTLILIAIIVLIFSGGSRTEELDRDVRALRQEVLVLQEKIDTLTHAIMPPQPAEAAPQVQTAP